MRSSLVAVAVLGGAIFCSGRSLNAQTQADWDWTNKEYGPVLDSLMPLHETVGFYVSYRSNRRVPEYWFRIGHDFNEKQGHGFENFLSAHMRIASPNSIYDQMMTLHLRDPATREAANFVPRIKLKRYDFNEMNCPAIKSQMDKFEKLQIKLPDINGNLVTIDPTIHAFYADGAEGTMSIVLTDQADETPLVKWALETRQVLQHCVKSD